jgi:hypothetical protein
MRIRIKKGTLVASTNQEKNILSRRWVVEVYYNYKKGIVKAQTSDVRTSNNQ